MPSFGDVTENLDEKVGGVPVWVWGAGIGAIILGVMYLSNRSGSASDDGDSGTAANPLQQYSDAYAGSGGGLTTENLSGAGETVTNAMWLAQGIRAATAAGFSAVKATAALNRYLNGEQLTAEQRKIVDAVVATLGPAPDGAAFVGGQSYSQAEVNEKVDNAKSNAQKQLDKVKAQLKKTQEKLAAATKPKTTPKPKPKAEPKPRTPGKVAIHLSKVYRDGADFTWKINEQAGTEGIRFQTSWDPTFKQIGHNYIDPKSPTSPRNQKPNTQYYARAQAFDGPRVGEWSDVVAYKTLK